MEVTKDSLILDLVMEYPQLEDVFKPYDEIIGKCVMCHHLFETLDEFSSLYNLVLSSLLSEIKEKIQG